MVSVYWVSGSHLNVWGLPEGAVTPEPASTTPTPEFSPSPEGGNSQFFPGDGQTVPGDFLDYWQAHGGLAQEGYPISGVMSEISDLDGKPYTVQYFERAVFELHPEY